MRTFGEEEFNVGFRYIKPREDIGLWTIADRFGNILLDWRKGNIKTRITLSDMESYIVVEEDGKTDIYFLYSSRENNERSRAIKYPAELGIINLTFVNYKTLMASAKESVYFVTPGIPQRKSDEYDALYPSNSAWVYEKTVEKEGYQTTISGPIDTDGRVGDICYDKFFRKPRHVVKTRAITTGYDVIDTTEIEQDLSDRQQEDNRRKIAKVRALVRDFNKDKKNRKDE